MELIYELNSEEAEWWDSAIQRFRSEIIQPPTFYLNNYVSAKNVTINDIKGDISNFIYTIRESCWDEYLKDEVLFHSKVIAYLIENRDIPMSILSKLIESKLIVNDKFITDIKVFKSKMSELVGEYAGMIMPYIYRLSLSTTNSRRSRAGKTFEAVNELILRFFNYPYEDQAQLGTKFYKTNGIGKMVDAVIPDKIAYSSNRNHCMVITMKTTLRERWQEVVEELTRTNIPHIYLLTLDKGITANVLMQLKEKNITIVDYDEVKARFKSHKNIISYSEFYLKEVPYHLSYWENK